MGDQFHRDQPLIMVWGNHDVKLAGVRAVVKAISGMRTRDGNAFGRALPDGGCQDIAILPAEHSAFSCMRIDGRYGYAALVEFEAAQFPVDETNQLNVTVG